MAPEGYCGPVDLAKLLMNSPCVEKMCLGALGPPHGKDNDALVVQILKGQARIAKQKVLAPPLVKRGQRA
jgi:hypothetical protein